MEVYQNIKENMSSGPVALSLGMFDGVHLGHQSIIKKLQERAESRQLRTGILTFWPHPRLVFNPNDSLKLLSTLEEKCHRFETLGIDFLQIQDFSPEFRNLSGTEFVEEILVKRLKVKHLIVGYDHVFGKNRSGNFQLLESLAPKLGFEVEQMEAVNLHLETISSTKIREALEEGKIGQANAMLGYDYSLTGTVVHGKKLGRTLGYPTANFEVSPLKLLPQKGAYIVEVFHKGIPHKGMLSIGTNPTVGGERLTVEVNLLDFNQDLYGQQLEVHFKEFLHEEIKFEGLESLVEKLKEDERKTRDFFLD
ncbi:bifunctional riboflavin kinase/FAD synthetase [Chryseobacterium sp. A301]